MKFYLNFKHHIHIYFQFLNMLFIYKIIHIFYYSIQYINFKDLEIIILILLKLLIIILNQIHMILSKNHMKIKDIIVILNLYLMTI